MEAESVAKKLEVLDRNRDKDSSESKDTDQIETKPTDDKAPTVKGTDCKLQSLW